MRLTRLTRHVATGALVLVAGAALAVYLVLRASLPQLSGEIRATGLARAATIERDAQGTPTLRAASRKDLAFATGFVHAQDRFFQMDLLRRAAAGELAELLGAGLLDVDRQVRVHGFRAVAAQVIGQAKPAELEVLQAYAAGVNLALEQLGARPWEYLLLSSDPAAWRLEDSLLVAYAMYLDLNDSSGVEEIVRAQQLDSLPRPMFDFLHPLGTEWDAPLEGGTWRTPPIPGPEVLDLRSSAARVAASSAPPSRMPLEERALIGSNSWAVAGTHAANGAALLANDMHLGLRLPHVWYRARLIVEAPGAARRDLVGITLPGLPMLIAGSNGAVAWGFTNSYGDWTDIVVVETDPNDPGRYLTAEGPEPFSRRTETLHVRGASPVRLTVEATRWGPVVGRDAAGRPLALAWTAHHPEATNIRLIDLEAVRDLEQALAAASRVGTPVQNFVAVDQSGRIGWTVMGQVPVRSGYDTTLPSSWRGPGSGWTGWRKAEEYPRVLDPASGRLWTANARTIDVETWLSFLGEGGYSLGARAAQIRDALLALPEADAADMLAIQIDDRALFLARWRDLALEVLHGSGGDDDGLRAQARLLIEQWSGRASPEDVGYRIVRTFRLQTRKQVFDSLTAPARARHPQATFEASAQFEGPLWQLVTRRPAHLLDPRYESWEAALLAAMDEALAEMRAECGELGTCTWGRHNTLLMRHPLSTALPFARHWLDMPMQPLPGDTSMPRVQGATFGASERLVVSPGREAEGLLQMPGGPVDHPLSPFYGAGHEAWVRAEPAPLLPGEARYRLELSAGE